MIQKTPCQLGNPDDWFIGKDGRQYGDEEWLTETERRSIALSVMWKANETLEDHQERVRRALGAAERDRRRRALQRRRHAKEACLGCPVRTPCLDGAIERVEIHGTWGGLLEEEIRDLRRRRR